MNGPNRAIDLLRGGCILYIVAFWHLLGYIDGIDGYKNDLAYRLTIVVLGLFTLISGVLAGRMPLQWGRADLAVLQEPGDPDRAPTGRPERPADLERWEWRARSCSNWPATATRCEPSGT
jgi:hypothetical protein